MKATVVKLISGFLVITFSSLIFATPQAGATESGAAANVVQNPSTVDKKITLTLSDTKTGYFIKESAFREFIKRGKDKMKSFGQKLTFVFSNYSEIPSEIANALNHLTGGKGPGHLAEVFLLFMLMLAVGLGMKKFFNIPMKKYKQQLQGSVPKSFLQLTGRLSARTVIELLSFGVFAAAIVVMYLLFYPTQGPLYELAMVYLPPIFFMHLAFILLNASYSPTMPHMRISPQNCP